MILSLGVAIDVDTGKTGPMATASKDDDLLLTPGTDPQLQVIEPRTMLLLPDAPGTPLARCRAAALKTTSLRVADLKAKDALCIATAPSTRGVLTIDKTPTTADPVLRGTFKSFGVAN